VAQWGRQPFSACLLSLELSETLDFADPRLSLPFAPYGSSASDNRNLPMFVEQLLRPAGFISPLERLF